MRNRSFKCALVIVAALSYLIAQSPRPALAQASADDLQTKIDQRNKDIADLQKEISGYQSQIAQLGTQADSLSTTLKTLDLTQKKLAADIQVSQNKISAKSLEIQQLGTQISGKETDIEDDQRVIAHTFKALNEAGDRSLPEIVLSSGSLSETLNAFEDLGALQKSIYDRISGLSNDKAHLEAGKKAGEKAKADLVALNAQLAGQRAVVVATTAEKNSLLKDTKQSQASYQKMVAEKQALQAAFQQEVSSYESQLHLNVSLASIPHTGSGVLSWPLDSIKITQYFGNTAFATANPQIYNGKGHTGVDFAASIGTPVKAAQDGVVVGVANTDLVHGCYSFGKWIMVKHPNGLSTLYAHLSVQSVATGDTVSTGQIIGYSGNTGYTTGPHLHFGVYATDGVVIKSFDTSVNCRGALIPLADYEAYLNPLSYL